MNALVRTVWCKAVCAVLVSSMLAFDIAYACPERALLSAPVVNQETPPTPEAAAFRQSVFFENDLLGVSCSIAKCLFEDHLKLKHMPQTMAAEIGQKVANAGVMLEHVNAVVLRGDAIVALLPDDDIPADAIVLIPYTRDGKERMVEIALKDNLSISKLAGYQWAVSDTFVVKELPEDYAAAVARLEQAHAAAVAETPSEAPQKVEISEPVAEVAVPETGSVFSIRAVILGVATVCVVLAAVWLWGHPAVAAGTHVTHASVPWLGTLLAAAAILTSHMAAGETPESAKRPAGTAPHTIEDCVTDIRTRLGSMHYDELEVTFAVMGQYLRDLAIGITDADIEDLCEGLYQDWGLLQKDRSKTIRDTRFARYFNGESIDIVDASDTVIATADTGFVHTLGLFHRAANAFVVTPDGKLLFERRAPGDRRYELFLSIFGGQVEAGATYDRSIRAKLGDQLGLSEPLEGRLELVSGERYDEVNTPNREFRKLFIYYLTPAEYKTVLLASSRLDKEKALRSKTLYDQWLRAGQAQESGHYQVWGYYEESLEAFLSSPQEETYVREDRSTKKLHYLDVVDTFVLAEEVREKAFFTPDLLERVVSHQYTLGQTLSNIVRQSDALVPVRTALDELLTQFGNDMVIPVAKIAPAIDAAAAQHGLGDGQKKLLKVLLIHAVIFERCKKEELSVELTPDGEYRFHKRAVALDPDTDIFAQVRDFFAQQGRINIGYLTGLDKSGNPVPGRFFNIVESDEGTVDYAVFSKSGTVIPYVRSIPQGVLNPDAEARRNGETALIVVQNRERAKRPGRPGAKRFTGNEPQMRNSRPSVVRENLPLELWMRWDDAPSGNVWWILCNPFAIWPNWPDMPAGADDNFVQPYHITFSRGEHDADQSTVASKDNLMDTFTFFQKINESPSVKEGAGQRFRMAINGWYQSDVSTAPKGGASQMQVHAQLIRFAFPLERAKVKRSLGEVNGVTMSVLDDKEWGSGVVLETQDTNKKNLVDLIHEVIGDIAKKGDSFNIVATVENERFRVFIADKVAGTPEPYFSNEWAFSEFARAVVVDAPSIFYEFTQEQWREYNAIVAQIEHDASKERLLKEWFKKQKKAGRLNHISLKLFNDAIAAMNMTTAPKHQVEELVRSLVQRHRVAGGRTLAVDFTEEGARNIFLVGGKNASLAELAQIEGVNVPPGFSVTTDAYKMFMERIPGMAESIKRLEELSDMWVKANIRGTYSSDAQAARLELEAMIQVQGAEIREKISKADLPQEVVAETRSRYRKLCAAAGEKDVAVAVRSSATAEDMPTASFAGLQKTALNVRGADSVVKETKECIASLYGYRAIAYRNLQRLDAIKAGLARHDNLRALLAENTTFKHSTVSLSVGIECMVPEVYGAGVGFNVNATNGEPGMTIEANFGLGESVVSNRITPDNWLLDDTGAAVLSKVLGGKEQKVVCREGGGIEWVDTTPEERGSYVFTDDQVQEIAQVVRRIGAHYTRSHGCRYVDTEFAVDAKGKVWFTQARPETVWGVRTKPISMVTGIPVEATRDVPIIFEGGFYGFPGAVSGTLRVVTSLTDATARVKQGDIMVAVMTHPEWNPVMMKTAGVIVDVGGALSHTAIIGREMGRPCLLATGDATKALSQYDGQEVTLDAINRVVYLGKLPVLEDEMDTFVRNDIVRSEKEVRDHLFHLEDTQGKWVGKPEYPLVGWQLELYLKAWSNVEQTFNCPLERKVENDIIYIKEGCLAALDKVMLGYDIDRLEALFRDRQETLERFLAVTEDFECTPEKMQAFEEIYARLISHFHIRWGFGAKVMEKLQNEQLARLPEALRSAVLRYYNPAVVTETTRMDEEFNVLVENARLHRAYFDGRPPAEMLAALAAEQPALYQAIVEHAYRFKYEKDDITRPIPLVKVVELVQQQLQQLVVDMGATEGKGRVLPPVLPELSVYVPDKVLFERILRLGHAQMVQKENEHHLQVRRQWHIREKLLEMGHVLAEEKFLQCPDDVFVASAEDLVGYAAEYQKILRDRAGKTPPAPSVPPAVPDQAVSAQVTELFDIVENRINNDRAKFVDYANTALVELRNIEHLKGTVPAGPVGAQAAVSDIVVRGRALLDLISQLQTSDVSPRLRDAADFMRPAMDRLETDGIIGNIIIRAREAKREGQALIVGFQTDFIPGSTETVSQQHKAMRYLVEEIKSLKAGLGSLGLGVEFVCEPGDRLADKVQEKAGELHTNMSHVVILASTVAIDRSGLRQLTDAATGERPFIAGIDTSKLAAYCQAQPEDLTRVLDSQVWLMLGIALDVAAGKRVTQSLIQWQYDEHARMIVFFPEAKVLDYRQLPVIHSKRMEILAAA